MRSIEEPLCWAHRAFFNLEAQRQALNHSQTNRAGNTDQKQFSLTPAGFMPVCHRHQGCFSEAALIGGGDCPTLGEKTRT